MADWSVTNESRGMYRILASHGRVNARPINSRCVHIERGEIMARSQVVLYCPKCGKPYKNLGSLSTHKKTMHGPEVFYPAPKQEQA